MSIKLMTEVWGKQVSGSEQSVLLALADFANDDGVCWPSQGVVGWKCGLTDRTVRSMVAKWKEQGVIEIISQGGLGRGKPSKIRLNLSKLPDKPPFTPAAYPEIFSGKETVTRKSDAVYPEIAVSDEPSVNRQLITETNVSADKRPKNQKTDGRPLLDSSAGEPAKEDDLPSVEDFPDDPSLPASERAARLLVRYNVHKGARERSGELGGAFQTVFGSRPTYARLESLRAKYGVVPLAEGIYRLAGKEFVGDPMDYLTATLSKTRAEGGRPKRIAWHPAGYRSEVDDANLTVSELIVKHANEPGTPHALMKRKRTLESRFGSYLVFEHMANVAYAKIARPDWINSSAGKALLNKLATSRRRYTGSDDALRQEWNAYCDLFADPDYREQMKEMQIP